MVVVVEMEQWWCVVDGFDGVVRYGCEERACWVLKIYRASSPSQLGTKAGGQPASDADALYKRCVIYIEYNIKCNMHN